MHQTLTGGTIQRRCGRTIAHLNQLLILESALSRSARTLNAYGHTQTAQYITSGKGENSSILFVNN